ncbi:MAG: hypothetical protein DWP92_09325 [Armatimonadetes bacterium]|nr:MAG: hypothetical protein DWP92_09325 [Armatimonadota bacterium]
MSDDFTLDDDLGQHVRAVFSELESRAPKPPKLNNITAGRQRLTAVQPNRWKPIWLAGGAAAAMILIVGVAVLIGAGMGTDDTPVAVTFPTASDQTSTTISQPVAMEGVWLLDSYTYKGVTDTIDRSAYLTANSTVPFVKIESERITGHSGCNDFGSQDPPIFEGGILTVGETIISAADCEMNAAEEPLTTALWSPDGIAVALTEDTMVWTTAEVVLEFRREDQQLPPWIPEWPHGFGRLDCGIGWVITKNNVVSTNIKEEPYTAADWVRTFPGVVSSEGTGQLGDADPFVWGLDANGVVIVGAAPGDIQPFVIHLSACATAFNMRAEANPAHAVSTWQNLLGLGQADPQVWNERLIGLCDSKADNLLALAEQFLAEDASTSVRADGGIPDTEATAEVLDRIRLMMCPENVSPNDGPTSGTTVPPVDTPGVSCSAGGLSEISETESSFVGLTAAAAETRRHLIDSAVACDLEALVDLAVEAAGESIDDAIFWGAAQSVETLDAYDATDGSLQKMVRALTSLPYSTQEWDRFDQATQTTVTEVYYSWPPQTTMTDEVGLAHIWDEELLATVASINGMTVEDLVAFYDEFGAYAHFRVGISENGRWMFALSGD